MISQFIVFIYAFELLTREFVYPYEFMDSQGKMEQKKITSEENYFSKFQTKTKSKNVWNTPKIETFR